MTSGRLGRRHRGGLGANEGSDQETGTRERHYQRGGEEIGTRPLVRGRGLMPEVGLLSRCGCGGQQSPTAMSPGVYVTSAES